MGFVPSIKNGFLNFHILGESDASKRPRMDDPDMYETGPPDSETDGGQLPSSASSASEDSSLPSSYTSFGSRSTSREHGRESRSAIAAVTSEIEIATRRSQIRFDAASAAGSDLWDVQSGVTDTTVLTEEHMEFYRRMMPRAPVEGIAAVIMIQSRIGPSYRASGFVPKQFHEQIVNPSMDMIRQVFRNGMPTVHQQVHGPFDLHVKDGTVVVSLRPNERMVAMGAERESLGLNYVKIALEEGEDGISRETIVNPRIAQHERSDMGLPITHIPVFFDPACLTHAKATDVTICTEAGTQGITFPHGACMVLDGLGEFFKSQPDESVSLTLRNCFLTQGVFDDLAHKAFRSVSIESCGLLGNCTMPKMSRLRQLRLNVFGLLNSSLELDVRKLPMLERLSVDTRFRFVVRRSAKKPVQADVLGSWESAAVLSVRNRCSRPFETLHLFVTHDDVLAMLDPARSESAIIARLFGLSAKQVAIDVTPATSDPGSVPFSSDAFIPDRSGVFVTSPNDLNFSPFNLDTVQQHHIKTLLPETMGYESLVRARILSSYNTDLLLSQRDAEVLWQKIVHTGAEIISVGPTLSLMLGFSRFGRSLSPARSADGTSRRRPKDVTNEGVQRSMLRTDSRTGPAAVVIGIDLWMDRGSVWVPAADRHQLMCVRYPVSVPELGMKMTAATVEPVYRHVEVSRSMFQLRNDHRLPSFNETSLVFCRPDCVVFLPASATPIKTETDLEPIRSEMATAMDAIYPVAQPPNMCGPFFSRWR